MSDEKLLRLYLNMINGKLRFISGGLVTVEYNHDCDIYDSYYYLMLHIRRLYKKGALK